jgi:two-component system sensor histidine kinase/response regulator
MASAQADILIVDDLPSNLLALEAILADQGREIVRASSGQEALRILLEREFAVVLLDVRMPEMDGIETAKFIRQWKTSRLTPILFVTAGDDDLEAVVRGYSAGAVDYIRKPVNAEILRSKVKVFVDLHLKKRELALQAEELARANEELRASALERERAENEIRAAYRHLETFSYTMAHNLRAPLRAMTGFSQILRQDYSGKPFDRDGQDYALRIEKGAREMEALIQDLLAYCWTAHASVELVRVDPGSVVKEVLERKAAVLEGKVEVQVAGPFPPVVGDRNLLDHVIGNLVSNAATFARPDARPSIRIGHEAQKERVRLWVEDNGIGIAPEHHDRIFGTFERLNGKEAYPGAGMGLAIVKTAMERMGGLVGLVSEPGKGSRFWIELPRSLDA